MSHLGNTQARNIGVEIEGKCETGVNFSSSALPVFIPPFHHSLHHMPAAPVLS